MLGSLSKGYLEVLTELLAPQLRKTIDQQSEAISAARSWSEMGGVANHAGEWRIFKSITYSREAVRAMTQRKT